MTTTMAVCKITGTDDDVFAAKLASLALTTFFDGNLTSAERCYNDYIELISRMDQGALAGNHRWCFAVKRMEDMVHKCCNIDESKFAGVSVYFC